VARAEDAPALEAQAEAPEHVEAEVAILDETLEAPGIAEPAIADVPEEAALESAAELQVSDADDEPVLDASDAPTATEPADALGAFAAAYMAGARDDGAPESTDEVHASEIDEADDGWPKSSHRMAAVEPPDLEAEAAHEAPAAEADAPPQLGVSPVAPGDSSDAVE
jgi:hypothetical protein